MGQNSMPHVIRRVWFKAMAALVVSSLFAISFWSVCSAKGFTKNDATDAFTSYLDDFIPERMNVYGVPGLSIALVKNGETIWTQGYGYADIASGREMTADTYVRVQSISKSVTAWGVMKLAEQGIIDLDASVKQYLGSWEFPKSQYPAEEITIRQLLCHTAGMPQGDFYNIYSPGEDMPSLMESLAKEAVLFQPPGTSFSYSNTGYNLLELVIENVTGRDFSEYMRNEVLLPLGMDKAAFTWDKTLYPPVPFGYNMEGEAVPLYVYPEKASGGLFATAADIASFITAGMPEFSEQNVLSRERIQELYTPASQDLGVYSLVFDAYGLGYYLETLPEGYEAVSHGGQGTGWMTYFYAVPETGDGIVILTNSQRSWPLMAYILRDWAGWSGFSGVGMEVLISGEIILWVLMGIVWAVTLLMLWGLAEGLVIGNRCFAPLSKQHVLRRVMQGIVSAVLALILIWCLSQDYLFVSSVLPRTFEWMAATGFGLAAAMALSALFPKRKNAGACNAPAGTAADG